MSFPTMGIVCDRCDYRMSFTELAGRRVYADADGEVEMGVWFGWCRECGELRPVESFGDAGRLVKEVEEALAELMASSPGLGRIRWHGPGRRRRDAAAAETVRAAVRRLALAVERRGTERCLHCGSRDITPFDGKVDLEYDTGLGTFVGRCPSGVHHPGCGGEFIVVPETARCSLVPKKWIYSRDGLLMEQVVLED